MKVLILGGAGLMAEAIERDLLEIDADEVSKITVADINSEKLSNRIEELKSPKVVSALIDMADHEALTKLIKGHDVVVNAAAAETTLIAVRAALQAGVNFIGLTGLDLPGCVAGAPLDEIGLPTQEFKDQVDKDFRKAGLTAILGLGSGPGINNVMGRYFADMLDTVESMEFVYVYANLAKTKTLFAFKASDMIGLYRAKPVILRDGKLIRVPTRFGRETALFPEPIGERVIFYIFHDEPIIFANSFRDKGLKNAGTKAGMGPEFLSKLEFLENLRLLSFRPRKVGEVMVSPVQVLESGLTVEKVIPQDYSCTRLVVIGEKAGQKLEYTAEMFARPYKELSGTQHRTGIPAAVGVRMLRRGQIKRKGALTPEFGVEPEIFFRELARRELRVSYTVKHLIA